jgi:protein-S-isoprenylcysteine O-methyltransferase Ste14
MLEALKDAWAFAKWWGTVVASLVVTAWAFQVFFSTAEREWLALPYALGGAGLLTYGAVRLIDLCCKD